MPKHSMPEMKEGGVNVTPLIDVVMCLIIFFMLVAKIGVSTGLDNKIEAPQTYLGVKISDMSNVLALNIYNKGDVEGADTSHVKGDAPLIVADLPNEKQKQLNIDEDRGGKKVHPLREVLQDMKKNRGEMFKVVINAGKDMRYAQIQLVLQACAEAGVTNVNFAAKRATKTVPG